ncbi:MAG: endonuclease/exonuclease/phosphatase family protein, partial [Bacteroidetes bacterium]|nr:endonuclease/exonuclease/phosphatase family protein [Bacteroidota bacterium]
LWCTLPILLFGIRMFLNFWNFSPDNTHGTSENTIKIVTYNVRVFNLYNWIHNLETRAEIFKQFQKQDPDILCMQEFYTSSIKPFNNIDTLPTILRAKNIHALLPIKERGQDEWGIATFTSYPIIHRETIFSDSNSANGCIATDIVVNKDTVRIYNVHLQSIRLMDKDYRYIHDFSANQSGQQLQGAFRIIKLLKKAFGKRARQAEDIAESIKNCPYKIIVAGDFNDTPSSYAYHLISRQLKDSFLEKGKGISSTYIGPLPWLRIDYILHSPAINCVSYTRVNSKLSDHHSIQAVVNF